MKKLAFLGGAAGLGLIALLYAPATQAADHLDANALATNPMADINDVYSWMSTDGAKINLALTVSPFDDGTRSFGSSVQYVFHLTRHAQFPVNAQLLAMGEEYKVICTLASNTDGQCWVVDPTNKLLDYVKGDFSATAGKASASGKVKVFAGRRSDPFFFNLGGFLRAQAQIKTACGANMQCPGVIPTNAAGCPRIDGTTAGALRGMITSPPPAMVGPCAANQADCFANANVMAIVVQLDKTLVVDDTKKLLGVWASTHAAQ